MTVIALVILLIIKVNVFLMICFTDFCFVVVTGSTPFGSSSPYHTYSNILMGKITTKPSSARAMSKNCVDLIEQLLQRNRVKRLGYQGSDSVKRHRWFRNVDWDLLKKKQITAPWVPGTKVFDRLCEEHPLESWLPVQSFAGWKQKPQHSRKKSGNETPTYARNWFENTEWVDF
jgi:hypothetical protein